MTTKKEKTMTQPNPNDTKFEQQKSESEISSLKNQTEDNYDKDTDAAAERIANNLEEAKKDK